MGKSRRRRQHHEDFSNFVATTYEAIQKQQAQMQARMDELRNQVRETFDQQFTAALESFDEKLVVKMIELGSEKAQRANIGEARSHETQQGSTPNRRSH
jgi:hypothetical protein